jgi:hypothetical protein
MTISLDIAAIEFYEVHVRILLPGVRSPKLASLEKS